jgi:hypothetical protein
MPALHVIYDPTDRLQVHHETKDGCKLKVAALSVPANLDDVDIYNLAKRLAELLLEQICID